MNTRVDILGIVLALSAALEVAALADKHNCAGVGSRPTHLEPRTVAAESKRALVKVAAYFEIINGTGEYFPIEFASMRYVHDILPARSYLSLRDGSCADLDLHFTLDSETGTYRVHLFEFYLKESSQLKHTCSNRNPGIEFKSNERFSSPAEPVVLKCHKEPDEPAHAEIVLLNLEIELEGDQTKIGELQFSKPVAARN